MINVNMSNEYHEQIILSDHLFRKYSKAAHDREHDIPVLHSVEVVHFHHEP